MLALPARRIVLDDRALQRPGSRRPPPTRRTPAAARRAATAASKTLREPSKLMCSLSREPATMMNARCTTTSAPAHSASTDAAVQDVTLAVLDLPPAPCAPGSNGRRAIPTILSTSRERSERATNGLPISPVGPGDGDGEAATSGVHAPASRDQAAMPSSRPRTRSPVRRTAPPLAVPRVGRVQARGPASQRASRPAARGSRSDAAARIRA